MRHTIARTVVCFICCIWAAGAQQDTAQEPSEPPYKRFYFGVRGGALINTLMTSQTVTESTSTTDPPLSTTKDSNSSSKRYTVGPTVQFNATDRLGINVEFLYKRTGYEAGTTVITQPTEEEAAFISGDYERTRADYWDFSVLARAYNKSLSEEGRRTYFTGGPVLRTVSGIKTFREKINEQGLSDTNTTPVQPAKKNALGAAVGVGMQLRDELGLKIDLEVRYTRWFQRIFATGLTNSNLNQAEAMIGLTF